MKHTIVKLLSCIALLAFAHGSFGQTPEYRYISDKYCMGEGDPGYEWHGQTYKQSGTYNYTHYDELGNDSLIEVLTLTVSDVIVTTERILLCDRSTLYWKGTFYDKDTVLEETYRAANGCDSIHQTEIVFGGTFRLVAGDTLRIPAQSDEPYYWRGHLVTGTGWYTDSYLSVQGCDSTYEQYIELVGSNINFTNTSICIVDTPFVWRGRKYSDLGTTRDVDTLWTKDGQSDSIIYQLHLTINPTYESEYAIHLCEGGTQIYRDKVYDHAGVFYETLQAVTGCDSIEKITVTVQTSVARKDSTSLKEGESYKWSVDGKTYKYKNNIQEITYPLKDQYGCDSNYVLIITPVKTVKETIEAQDCWSEDAQGYLWRGNKYYSSGTYYDTVHVLNSAIPDTIYTLKLKYGRNTVTHVYRELCGRGAVEDYPDIFDPGTYTIHLKGQYDCDSTIIVEVVYNPHDTTMYDTIPYGTTYQWYDKTAGLSEGTIQYNTRSKHKVGLCDTIFNLHVTWCYPFERDYYDTICESRLLAGEKYVWQNGDYSIPLRLNKDANGYRDSTFYSCNKQYKLQLHVEKGRRVHSDTIHLCEGESVELSINGVPTRFSESCEIFDTIPNLPGSSKFSCDSINHYLIQVHQAERKPIQEKHVSDTTKQYTWRGYTLDVPKDLGHAYYYDTIHSQARPTCDSIIYTLHLVVDTTYFFENHITICRKHNRGDVENDRPYVWEGHKRQGQPYIIDAAGVYWDSLRTKYTNVDSVFMLVVDTFPNYHFKEYREICQGDSTPFYGKWYRSKGTYYDTAYTAIYSCDSIHELVLNVIPVFNITFKKDISDKQIPYLWERCDANGTCYKDFYYWSGLYTDTLQSSRGCDSIVTLQLTVHPTFDKVQESATVCASQLPYVWHGRQFYKDTVCVDTLQTVMRYDSIVTLTLRILKSDTTTLPVTICYGSSFIFNDSVYTKGGRYEQKLTNQFGCDSIIRLQIKELAQIKSIQTVDVSTPSYTWERYDENGNLHTTTYTNSGTYYDTLTSLVNGCDSLLELRLTLHAKEQVRNVNVQECEANLPYKWNPSCWLTKDTTIYDTISTSLTDTIYVVNFSVIRPVRDTIRPTFCAGESYTYSGKVYTRDTLIHDTTYAELGCAKRIQSIDLHFRKLTNLEFTDKASDKQPYIWTTPDGATYTIPTKNISTNTVEREHIIRYSDGLCDSVRYHLTLSVGKTYFFPENAHMCLPDTLWWHGQMITKGGFYFDSLLTKGFAYDSVYHLTVTAHNDTTISEQYNIPAGTTQIIRGVEVSQTGIYYAKYIDHHGCDSIYKMTVNMINPTVTLHRDTTICDGDYFQFYDQRLTTAGNYKHSANDSIITLSLHVNPTSISKKDTVIAKDVLEMYGFVYNNNYYNTGGIKYDTLRNQYNCDSVLIFNIIATEHYSNWDWIPLCTGSELKIKDKIITEQGQYVFLLPSRVSQMMDSIYRVSVYDAHPYDMPLEKVTICEGETFVFANDEVLNKTGRYDYRLETIDGCDSLVHLDLTVNPTYHKDTSVFIADYDGPFKWFNTTYDSTGVYDHLESTINHCDSSFTMKLTVVPTRRDTVTDTICIGQDFTWRGETYTKTILKSDTVRQLEDKQSFIYTLDLTVQEPVLIDSVKIPQMLCADQEGFDIEIFFSGGGKPTTYSLRFDELAKKAGFLDVENEPFEPSLDAHVKFPVFDKFLYQNHPVYVRPNNYTLRIELDNRACGIERSNLIEMQIRYPSWILEQNWNDVVAPLKAELNGGYDFVQLEWYVNDTLQATNDLPYLYNPNLRVGDEVVLKAVRRGENFAIWSCPLIISGLDSAVYDTPVIIYPTQAPQHAPLFTIEAPQDGQYAIYSATGLLIGSGKIPEGQTQVKLPAMNGIYFIRTQQGAKSQTHKVLVY